MTRVFGLVLFAVGVVLFAMGVSASESFSSDVSRIFHGTPTDRSTWLILGGLAGIILGAGGLMISRGHTKRA